MIMSIFFNVALFFLIQLLILAENIDCWSINNFLITGSQATIQHADTVALGAQKGLSECGRQFTYERWPCPDKVFTNSIFRNSLPINREIAYVQAIISAGITYTVTKKCNAGTDSSCSCDRKRQAHQQLNGIGIDKDQEVSSPKNHFQDRGCSDNIEYGIKIAQMYLDSNNQDSDLRGQIRRHNNEAGRNAIKETMIKTCKCHGFSGACSTKTCWMKLNDFREVGAHLKRAYKKAVYVDSSKSNDPMAMAHSGLLATVPKSKLAFSLQSPDYCKPSNSSLSIAGTLGRKCSMRKNGHDVTPEEKRSCRNLCKKCGYAVKEERKIVETSCNCKFKFCCEVQCEKCLKEEISYVCVERN